MISPLLKKKWFCFYLRAGLSQIWWYVCNLSHVWEAEAGRLLQADLSHSREFKAAETLAHKKSETNKYWPVRRNARVHTPFKAVVLVTSST